MGEVYLLLTNVSEESYEVQIIDVAALASPRVASTSNVHLVNGFPDKGIAAELVKAERSHRVWPPVIVATGHTYVFVSNLSCQLVESPFSFEIAVVLKPGVFLPPTMPDARKIGADGDEDSGYPDNLAWSHATYPNFCPHNYYAC